MGESNQDQLVKICQVLGTDGLYKYLKKYNIKIEEEFSKLLGKYICWYWECLPDLGRNSLSLKLRLFVTKKP